MKIKLNEIPEDGRQYSLNRETAELNGTLEDLISQNDYKISLDIRPLNSRDFTVNGQVSTKTHEQCSRCGQDFNFGVEKTIREILIPTQEQGRTGKYAKSASHHVTDADEEVSVTEYSKQQFDLGEFLHEAIALEVPFNPFCDDCLQPENNKAFIYDEKMGEEQKPNPFSALKGIKID
ncbi:YceD family protein [Pseudobdellovibrio exovorus]|uniref:DUF177 domain-containing protein n=1 Tax=Pseudobdellovibrio exovorus JSS TaxID=1184267 RepID=M4VQV7_9BACT|nr:YceD family protein [Pseudobdellovibrio exovorus]AGH95534.1 hypothetical protein A11Q_1318 [Pseudobdellovibrio exovorus JSS]